MHGPRDEDGALIAFTDPALYDAACEALTDDDAFTNHAQAVAQCERLAGEDGLAARLLAVDAATWKVPSAKC